MSEFVKKYGRKNIDHGYLLSAIFYVNKEMIEDFYRLSDIERQNLYIFIEKKIKNYITNGIEF